jgi:peptidyl-prolyl cis-trans isomerase C
MLDDMIRAEMYAKEAERRGLGKDPEFVRTVKEMLGQRLLKDELDKVRLDQVTDAQCRQFFDAHLDAFNQPEQVQVSWILVNDAATAKRVLADPRIKAPPNEDAYHKLVSEFSQDEQSKEHSGMLPYFADDTKAYPKELVSAAFNLANPGDVSQPVKTAKGYVVLKLVGRKKALIRQFPEVKQQIRNNVFREQQLARKKAFEQELREKSQVKTDDSKLSYIKIEGAIDPPAGSLPPQGVPASGDRNFSLIAP